MDDLRDFLHMLDEFEEVQRIKAQVDWNLRWDWIT
jgi:3-polyprenyl-4-hydroxybenzoate decarboxylase